MKSNIFIDTDSSDNSDTFDELLSKGINNSLKNTKSNGFLNYAPIRKQTTKRNVIYFSSDSSSSDGIQVIQRTDLNLQTDSENSDAIIYSQSESDKSSQEINHHITGNKSSEGNFNETKQLTESKEIQSKMEDKDIKSDENIISQIPDFDSQDLFNQESPNKGIDDPSLIHELNSTIIRLPGHKVPKGIIPYIVRRENKLSLHGKRTIFQLLLGGKVILSSKIKTLYSTDFIHISSDNKYHFSNKNDCGTIRVYDNFTNFSLRKGNEFGDEIMTMKFIPSKIQYAPRDVELVFIFPPNDISPKLKNRKPKITAASTWSLNLNGRTAKRSNKNCILVDDNDKEHIVILKHHSSELYIETIPSISSLCIFATGICSFLCKLKST